MKTANELAYEFPEQNLLNLEHDAVTKLNGWGIEAAAMLRSQAAEIESLRKANIDCKLHFDTLKADYDALKADAERYRAIRPLFQWDNEGGHGQWSCSFSWNSWGNDCPPDSAIDEMKGKS